MSTLMSTADRHAAIVQMTREGSTAREIAQRLKVTPRTVTRVRSAMGIANEAPAELTAEQIARIELLIGEGMPSTWVAEDVGCARWTVLKYMRLGREATSEWLQAWCAIRPNPTLLQLHREFAPRDYSKDRAADVA